ncbi:MAG: DUF305 domain-containing protein [Aphanocapsa sp. GSE-SYN-MK-11-07L]|jgi:uncharacterized protein (DUF305 family)|nr:DUF305 domain-containing protein [Aphanocapsa sp. GSE-SYN-MK-11-07L]
MRKISFKTSSLGFLLVVIGALTACSATSQSQPTPQPSAAASGMGEMGGINHSMGMDLGPADPNFDLRFIDGMIPHHQGAVVMAKQALSKAKHPELKKLAEAIIKAQDQELAEMQQWRSQWYAQAPATPMAYDSQMGHMMPMSEAQKQSMMMSMDLGAADPEFDLRFINAMIPHHQGALVMAEDALKKSQRAEIKTLAQNIITSQQAEIKQMQGWKKAWYNQ